MAMRLELTKFLSNFRASVYIIHRRSTWYRFVAAASWQQPLMCFIGHSYEQLLRASNHAPFHNKLCLKHSRQAEDASLLIIFNF